MKIVIVGMGYVGVSLSVLLSQYNEVYAIDIAEEKINLLKQKKSPIMDKQIEDYLSRKALNLHPTTDLTSACKDADYIIVSTSTDYDPVLDYFDTSSVEAVVERAVKIAPQATIVIKSTVPIGFTAQLIQKTGVKNILFSPEFLREGLALWDNLYPSRIIVGMPERGIPQKKAEEFADLLKQGALTSDPPVLFTGLMEAEATKLFANAYLAMRVVFFNELDSYAEMKGLSTKQIIEGIGLDPRIGNHYNNPSFGYGGYCLPKDTKQLLANYKNIPNNIISAIVAGNRSRKDFVAARILERSPKVVGIYHLAMKTNSDNFRQSSVLDVMQRLTTHGVKIIIYDPMLKEDVFLKFPVEKDLLVFKTRSDIIVANRYDEEIEDVMGKVYTRDLWRRD